jgi:hypothetical protein
MGGRERERVFTFVQRGIKTHGCSVVPKNSVINHKLALRVKKELWILINASGKTL